MKISAKILENLNLNLNSEKSTESKNDKGLFNAIFEDKNFSSSNDKKVQSVYQNLKSTTKEKKAPRTTNNVGSDENSRVLDKSKENKADNVDKTKETKKTSKNEKLEDVADDAKKEAVYNEMANFLGITVDELKLKLEEMGISEDSLTSLEGVRAAILELTGLTDATELVNLAGIKELFSKVDDILNMSTEDAIAMALENKGLTSVEELLEQANTLANEKLNSEDTKEVEQVVEQNTVKSNVETNTTKSDANIVDSEMVNQTTDTVDESTNNAVVSNAQETLAEETGAVNEVAEDVNLEGNKVLQVMEEINQEAVSAQAVQSTQAQSQMGQGQSGGNNQNANPNANNGAQDVMNNIMFTQDVKGQATTFSTIVNNRMNQNINQQEVINQIVEKMKVSVNGDTSEVSITLRPEHLGDVTLKIATHNGVVTAEFLAQSEEVKALIEANFQDLQETLRQKGIEVSNFTTGLLSDGQKETNSNNRRSRNNNRNIGGVETLEEEQVEELEEIKISNIDYSV